MASHMPQFADFLVSKIESYATDTLDCCMYVPVVVVGPPLWGEIMAAGQDAPSQLRGDTPAQVGREGGREGEAADQEES